MGRLPFIKLWENIESKKIYVEDGVVKGKDKKPLQSSLLTYFMGIAKIKYLEYVREPSICEDVEVLGKDFNRQLCEDVMYGGNDNVQLEIIADLISRMSPRCNEILTKFYYEKKNLDTILAEMASIETKDALKTKKYKCLESLRKTANDIYNNYLNH